MIQNFDYIIVGAGASGLMMAYRMASDTYFDDKSILIIDKEKKTKNDRTWCFWEENSGELDAILTKQWNTILFKSNTVHKASSIQPYSYKMIRSSSYYDKIWAFLEIKSNISFKLEQVQNILQQENDAKVITDKNEYHSKNVLNSILFSDEYKTQRTYPTLQQHFVGYFIKTKQPVFDDAIATFMDFSIPQKGNTRFMYVLPYSRTEALFEYTLFSKDFLEYEEYTSEIEKYLKEKVITDFEVIEKEKGAIPMTSYKFWKQNSKNIIHIGTAGGWSKASTGFTFKNTLKNSKRLLNHLKNNKSLKAFHVKNRFWFYDLLLLDILSKNNDLGASIFTKMFQHNSPQIIFKFLDEETTITEEILIFLKMPKRLFIKALFKRVF